MGWFSEVTTPYAPVCPKCGQEMDTMQTKGYEGDQEYFIEHGEPYSAPLEKAMVESSVTTPGGRLVLHAINSCRECDVYAEWTFYDKEQA